ncbi:MAG: hypothetical protein C4535_07815 [Comamonadaceae bacterium]|nr:MAG: hypothetical protein C4535_07815 [Comamonadaceae bacterium]
MAEKNESSDHGSVLHWSIDVAEKYTHYPVIKQMLTLGRILFVDIAPSLPRSQVFALTEAGKLQIGAAAALIVWILCLVIPGVWSMLIGTHLGDDPGRLYFFKDWHNLILYTVIVPCYVAAGAIVIATVASGLWEIRQLDERVCCAPVRVDRVLWRVPLLVLFILLVAIVLTSTYINDVSDVNRIGVVYWFLERLAAGDVRLNSLGVYYFLLNFLLLLFTLVSLAFFMSAFGGTIKLANSLSSAEPGTLSALEFGEMSLKLKTYVQAYFAAKVQVAFYIANFWIWEKSPLGQTGNLMIAHIFLFLIGGLFLGFPRAYFELQWWKLKSKAHGAPLGEVQFDRLLTKGEKFWLWVVDIGFIGTIMTIPILDGFMSYSR